MLQKLKWKVGNTSTLNRYKLVFLITLYVIGVGAGKYMGVRRIFAQISLNLPQKSFKENDLPKKRLPLFSCWVHFVKSKHTSTPKHTQISPTLPEKNKKTWPQKNVCTLILGASFRKSKHIQRVCEPFYKFSQISTDFARILSDFAGIFTNQKDLGVLFHPLHPRRLHQCCMLIENWNPSAPPPVFLKSGPQCSFMWGMGPGENPKHSKFCWMCSAASFSLNFT